MKFNNGRIKHDTNTYVYSITNNAGQLLWKILYILALV